MTEQRPLPTARSARRPCDSASLPTRRAGPQDWFAHLCVLGILAILAASLLALSGCAAKNTRAFHLVPLPDPTYSVEGGAVTVKNDDFRLTVIPLDDLTRQAFIRSKVEGAIDPFRSGPGNTPHYITFRVFLENLNAVDSVAFQPQSVYLASESGDRLFPMDYPEAYSKLFGTVSSDPRFLEDLQKYMFDVGVNVPPGGRVEGLLAYPLVARAANKLRMEFNFLQTGGVTNRNLDIYFHKEPDL